MRSKNKNKFLRNQNFCSSSRDCILELLSFLLQDQPSNIYSVSYNSSHQFPKWIFHFFTFLSVLKHLFSSHFIVCNQRSEIIVDVPLFHCGKQNDSFHADNILSKSWTLLVLADICFLKLSEGLTICSAHIYTAWLI